MPSTAILQEAEKLHNVSDRLDSLAEEHPRIGSDLCPKLAPASVAKEGRGRGELVKEMENTDGFKLSLLRDSGKAEPAASLRAGPVVLMRVQER
jgi:hypothetical protein